MHSGVGFLTVRRQVKRRLHFVFVLLILTTALVSIPATTTGLRAEVRTLPLPRFVSLKASPANLRVGPGTGYDIEWVMTRPGIPLEIYQEYDNWRRVRDWEGTTGWIYSPLLSGRRTGIVAPWANNEVALRKKPTIDGPITAWLEPRVGVRLTGCDGKWCAVALGMTTGFVRQTDLWGAYPGEVL
ncbi:MULTISPECIES: SH3 domain-containing protein [unclassified Mesorhizobium]|uniref:SH3 domain-containing protein n=1 Tax=unclassified Mesorhizobium TaxID=325217 RepID=UPI000BB077A9|nr:MULTISPECIES: SH3 domain-containing protein [unclassified Mesorhizobium]TGT57270.1 aspartyl-trna synthetase [Mesorhizobium sp. M00.F.Ca.ET.170.01.1.1]AZO11975.1 aspartyl-trna synthetase [Mesorhizobium sp. M3A.F.Ca.ET.080.04.2.1]PBB86128.1 aspartyl-trna synthetase [Mesorhizobium sp. WSM3876]RWB66736.1 MAG: aspartyl-trna synthetase [Mesorhizobium sp.]RWB90686.1 MAG: aspartyl-trna synthetase [Mesorhizobium sp.]